MLYSYEALDSTQQEASRLLTLGCQPPFLVWARTQTNGQGRTGASWVSPPGNLYITLVLPPSDLPAEIGLVPLQVAGVIARWAFETFGISSLLKWPNDLLLGPKKWGGILCESSRTGDTWGPLLIGIGLNLQSAPALKDSSYESTCLRDELRREIPIPIELVEKFRDFFGTHWKANGMRWFDQFKTPDGTQWLHKEEGTIWVQQTISTTGALVLREPMTGREISLTSARHPYQLKEVRGSRSEDTQTL